MIKWPVQRWPLPSTAGTVVGLHAAAALAHISRTPRLPSNHATNVIAFQAVGAHTALWGSTQSNCLFACVRAYQLTPSPPAPPSCRRPDWLPHL